MSGKSFVIDFFIRNPLPHKLLFTDDGDIDISLLKSHLQREGRLHKPDALLLSRKAEEIFRKEPNLLELKDPITSIIIFI